MLFKYIYIVLWVFRLLFINPNLSFLRLSSFLFIYIYIYNIQSSHTLLIFFIVLFFNKNLKSKVFRGNLRNFMFSTFKSRLHSTLLYLKMQICKSSLIFGGSNNIGAKSFVVVLSLLSSF